MSYEQSVTNKINDISILNNINENINEAYVGFKDIDIFSNDNNNYNKFKNE